MGYRNERYERMARDDAELFALKDFGIPVRAQEKRVGIILGAGCGDVFSLKRDHVVSLVHEPCKPSPYHFWELQPLAGHKRELVYDRIAGVESFVFSGRIHSSEKIIHPEYKDLVRLPVEILLQLGVQVLILTSAAINIRSWVVKAGDIVVANEFALSCAPDMPLDAGELQRPEETLDPHLNRLAIEIGRSLGFRMHEGGLAMVRGPLAPPTRADLRVLHQTRALGIVTSIIPEACIARLYPGTKVIALSRIGNDEHDMPSKDEQRKFGELLTRIIAQLP